MFDQLEKLRQKSDRTKKQVAFVTALFLAGIIFVIWLSIVLPDFRQSQAKEDSVSKLEPSPLSSFGDTLSTGISAIGEQFSKIKGTVTSITVGLVSSSTVATTTATTTVINQ